MDTPTKPTIDDSHEFPTHPHSTSWVISDPVAFYEAEAQYWEDVGLWWDTYQLLDWLIEMTSSERTSKSPPAPESP